MKKGSVILILVSGIALIALSAAGFFWYQTQRLRSINPVGPIVLNPSVTPTPTLSDETANPDLIGANWKTFTNPNFEFTFKYPSNWDVLPQGITGVIIAPQNIIAEKKKITGSHGGSIYDTFTIYKNSDLPPDAFVTDAYKEVTSEKIQISGIEGTKYTMKWLQAGSGGIKPGLVTNNIQLTYKATKYTFELLDNQYNQIFDQILSTFKFLNKDSTIPDNSNAKTYTSRNLGISFNYTGQTSSNGETIQVKENGDKVYVYSSVFKDYTHGQWVEVFTKNKVDSLTDAVQKRFLTNYSSNDCFVTTPATYLTSPNFYPSSYQTAMISVPRQNSEGLPTEAWAKCPEPYVTENGISYFLMDNNHLDKFVYFSIGQYPIESGLGDQSQWQDTIKFL